MNSGNCASLALLLCAAGIAACVERLPTSGSAAVGTPQPAASFRDATEESGLSFHHDSGDEGEWYFPEIMGGGVALLDYDSDGDLDIYLVQSGSIDSDSPERANRLFRNDLSATGELRFADVTDEANAAASGYGMGAATGDIDNDGDVDLYVTNFGANVLLVNNGDGTFSDGTAPSDAAEQRWSTSAAFFDYDRDGDLDLFVVNYVVFQVSNNIVCTGPAGQRDYCDPTGFAADRDRLWRNEGNGRFVDASEDTGIAEAFGNGLGVSTADLNGDLWPDIYVANDKMANLLWINRGDGTFEERGLLAGAAYNADGNTEAGMGVAAGDYDDDGDDDLFVTHLTTETNTLYQNNGHAGFVDNTVRVGLSFPSLPFTGFGVAWADVDNDSDLDLFVANGAVQIEPKLSGIDSYPYRQQNQLFVNTGGARFEDASGSSGEAMLATAVSRGAAVGDLDNDGDLDVVVANNNGPARLLLNETHATFDWLTVKLVGTRSNRSAYGAQVALTRGETILQRRRVHTDDSYLSARDPRVHFGLGGAEPDGVRVRWPSGDTERWRLDNYNREIELTEGNSEQAGTSTDAGPH